jgi:hypothetical protein
MKILIFDWAYAAKDILSGLGYAHKQELELTQDDFFKLIDRFLKYNLSVMIEKPASTHDYVIFVDLHGKRFKQR